MNPTFLDSMSWEMAEVYGAIQDQILINLARHFPYFNADNLPGTSFAYQAKMLAQMGQVNRETMQIIRNNLGDADEALQGVLEQAIISSVESEEPALAKAVRDGIFKPAGIPNVSPNQFRAFNLYYQQAAEKLNLVNTVMLESTQSAYQQAVSGVVNEIDLADRMYRTQLALDSATGETITGVSAWNQALKHATDRLKNGGITGFVDHAGRHWSAEAYVAMDIRTTVYNTGRAAVWETNQDFGNDLYIVSYHDGARPMCYDWQNKVISSTDNARTVTDLDGNEIPVYRQSDTSYGEPAGLFGINCKHYPSPFIPGVSVTYNQNDILGEKENREIYEQTQQQRSLERDLRERKRDILMAKAQGASDEEIRALRDKAKEASTKIDDFCAKTGLPRRTNREGVYTKREFPSKEKYDVSKFETKQKDLIDKYFSNGGAQQNFSAGQMTPKNPPPTPVPTNVAPQVTQPATNVVQSTTQEQKPQKIERKTNLLDVMERNDIERLKVTRYETQPTEQQIIEKICGWDKTKGSCVSTALAYTGNVNGLDVTDFRGGDSQQAFSMGSTVRELLKLDGIQGRSVSNANDFTTAHNLLKDVKPGKQYFFTAGSHAAVVRYGTNGIEYLELQGDIANSGWHMMNDEQLRWRFGCKRSHTFHGYKYEKTGVIFDIATVKGNREFEDILEFINTAEDAQRKGVGGDYR